MDQHKILSQVFMRIVAGSMFFYDYLATIPSEIRMYRRQRGVLHLTPACVLFIFTRYIGLATVCCGLAVYFGNLSEKRCHSLFPSVGALRAILSTVTSLVLLWRTWAIWARNRRVLILMSVALVPTTFFSYSFLFAQKPFWEPGACTGFTERRQNIVGSKWSFALFNLLYDLLACVVSSIRLLRHIREGRNLSRIPSILLADGIGYFFLVAVTQGFNLAFFLTQGPDRETVFALFNAALTSILSQRIILALAERVTLISNSSNSRRPGRRGTSGDVERGAATRAQAIAISVHTETLRVGGMVEEGSVWETGKEDEEGERDGKGNGAQEVR